MIICQENPDLFNIGTKNIVHCTLRPKYVSLWLATSNHHKSSLF